MKIDNVRIKVNRVNNFEGPKVDEVFVTCVDPPLNFAMYFQEEHFEQLESGNYTLEFVQKDKVAPPETGAAAAEKIAREGTSNSVGSGGSNKPGTFGSSSVLPDSK